MEVGAEWTNLVEVISGGVTRAVSAGSHVMTTPGEAPAASLPLPPLTRDSPAAQAPRGFLPRGPVRRRRTPPARRTDVMLAARCALRSRCILTCPGIHTIWSVSVSSLSSGAPATTSGAGER